MGMLPLYAVSGTAQYAGGYFMQTIFFWILLHVAFLTFLLCRSEQGLEFDLFLLQCCAALAPPDLYVSRILERFGLSDYLSLKAEKSTEYMNFPLILFV